MNEAERYETVDLPFYREQIAPVLPESVLDFHAHVSLDTSMVMDPFVLRMVFEEIGPHRIVFGTDLPVAMMRGRRVYAMDHWVDLVAEGYPPSAYRVAANGIRATFMAWEIVLAVRRAAEAAGISQSDLKAVFRDNGMRLLRNVSSCSVC